MCVDDVSTANVSSVFCESRAYDSKVYNTAQRCLIVYMGVKLGAHIMESSYQNDFDVFENKELRKVYVIFDILFTSHEPTITINRI